MIVWYKLIDKVPVPCDLDETFETQNRRVKEEFVNDFRVSTVFLPVNDQFHKDVPPLLFETMIFTNDFESIYCDRCSTWDQALEMHEKAKQWLMKDKDIKDESG